MRKYRLAALLLTVAAILVLMSVAISAAPGPKRSIVVFADTVNSAAQERLIERTGGVIVKDLNVINGKAVLLPDRASADRLAGKAEVVSVEADRRVTINPKPDKPDKPGKPGGGGGKEPPAQPAEELPWGIDRIDAEQAWPQGAAGSAVKVGVIDTGIQLDHPDLEANIKGGHNVINSRKSADDDNGHGTHVAGIIGAVDNEIGVVGVAPQVDLYAIKALDRKGNGWVSDIIEGLDWAVANDMDVVNMSLGLSIDVGAFGDAIAAANDAGVVLVAAAGNNYGGAVDYPGAYPEVIAVSAIDDNDALAGFSSVGPQVDLTAPGADVGSTYKNSGYTILSGTSMASPHVAGTAALVLGAEGPMTPALVKARLTSTADFLSGLSSSEQGSGLVDAEEAPAP